MFLAEIIGVGDELLYGETMDTNTSDIARSLQPYSIGVKRTLRVADDLETLCQEVKSAWASSRLVVLSGGLGPTPDDITREAIAAAFGESMEIDPEVLAWLENLFAGRNWKMPEVNKKQAMKIPSATWLENPRGTAPGWWIHANSDGEAKDLVCLPGPPGEWKPMWAEVLPKLALPAEPYQQITYKTFGLGESRIVELLGDLFQRSGNTEVGTYAKMHGVEVVIRGEPAEVAHLASEIRPLLGDSVWGQDDDTLPGLLLKKLTERGATIGTCESVTGGMLGQFITSIAGSSKIYQGGLVAYNEEVKTYMNLWQTVEKYGAISAEIAEDMAVYVQSWFGATYALSTTGVAGPDELEGKPVGTLYIGLAGPNGVKSKHYRLPGANRDMLRQRASYAGLAFLVGELE